MAERDGRIGIVSCNWLLGKHLMDPCLEFQKQILPGDEVARLLFEGSSYLFGTPTTLLFRRTALDDEPIWFRPEVFYDDTDLCLRILRRWKLGFVHQLLAFVREDDTGAFSRIRDFDFVAAYRYFLVMAYAHDFFDPLESARLQRSCRRYYFNRLARALLSCRGRNYWRFHRKLFKTAGHCLRARDLVIPLGHAALDLGLNPKATAGEIFRRFRRKAKSAPA
jgi:hypothetical protein